MSNPLHPEKVTRKDGHTQTYWKKIPNSQWTKSTRQRLLMDLTNGFYDHAAMVGNRRVYPLDYALYILTQLLKQQKKRLPGVATVPHVEFEKALLQAMRQNDAMPSSGFDSLSILKELERRGHIAIMRSSVPGAAPHLIRIVTPVVAGSVDWYQPDPYYERDLEHNAKFDPDAPMAKAHATRPLQNRLSWRGCTISIENEAGTVREGKDPNGKPWRIKMPYPYGYLRGTEGTDGDHLDVFVGPNLLSEQVYVVHVLNPESGAYDEDKAMIGFDSANAAKKAFLKAYNSRKFFGGMTQFDAAHFAELAKAGKLKRKAAIGKPTSTASRPELLKLLHIAVQHPTVK